MIAMKNIMIIDEKGTLRDLQPELEQKGYKVSSIHNGQVLERIESERPDLIILDGKRHREDFRSVRKRLNIPVLAIVDKGVSIRDNIGADAYLPRPLTTRKVLARIRKIVRAQDAPTMRVGDITLNLETRSVTKAGHTFPLTPKEFKLLKIFMLRQGEVLTRRYLMKNVWETEYIGDTRTLDVHIHWLRGKIEDDPNMPIHLRTVRGVGYRFEV